MSLVACHSSQIYYLNNLTLIGAMEHCNRSIEECIKKIMVSQEDGEPMLPSVLFAL